MKTKFEFKPFQKVLVRDDDDDFWEIDMFGRYVEGLSETCHPYSCLAACWNQCIPFEGNEHLLGTTDSYEEPFIPQEGDFIAFGDLEGDKRALQIIKSFKKDCSHSAYVTLPICLDTRDYEEKVDIGEDFEYSNINIRPATEEEKQLLLSKLHEIGKDWDAEKKEIVDWKWIPKRDDTYFYPCFDRHRGEFIADDVEWCSMDEWFDKAHYERGWVFRTKEDCQAMCDKLNAAIKNVK